MVKTLAVALSFTLLAVLASAAKYPDYYHIMLEADTGKYLSRCHGCGPAAYKDSATVHQTSQSPSSTWAVSLLDDTAAKVTLRSDNGKYLARCNGCWYRGAYSDAAFVHVSEELPYSTWTLEFHADYKVSLKSDTGKYLARCNGCAGGCAYPDQAFVHVSDPTLPYAKWGIVYVKPTGEIVEGDFLADLVTGKKVLADAEALEA